MLPVLIGAGVLAAAGAGVALWASGEANAARRRATEMEDALRAVDAETARRLGLAQMRRAEALDAACRERSDHNRAVAEYQTLLGHVVQADALLQQADLPWSQRRQVQAARREALEAAQALEQRWPQVAAG